MTGDELIEIVRARGNDARDARDAAHEAHHALDANVRGPWDRERIHRALMRQCRSRIGGLVSAELDARAVEQVVCRELGVKCWSVEECADITYLETAANMRIALPSREWVIARINSRISSSMTARYAQRVLSVTMPRRRRVA